MRYNESRLAQLSHVALNCIPAVEQRNKRVQEKHGEDTERRAHFDERFQKPRYNGK